MPAIRTRGRYESEIPEAAPQTDAYTWLLVISLVAMMIGCVLLFLDYNQYPNTKPELPHPVAPIRSSAPPQPPAGQPQAPPPGLPQQPPPGR